MNHQEQQDALERRFIELARMARLRPAAIEHQRPGHIADPPKQLAIVVVGEPAEEETDRRRAGEHVGEGEEGQAAAAGEQNHRQDHADETAMERHAALPDHEDLEWLGEIFRAVIEEDIADASAEDVEAATLGRLLQLEARKGTMCLIACTG